MRNINEVSTLSSLSNQGPFPEGRRCACEHIAAALDSAQRAQRPVAVMVLGLDERDDAEARSDDALGALFHWQAKAPADTNYTRIGTATFAVVASIGTSSEAYAMATDLLETVDPAFHRGASGACGAWLGISLFPEDNDDVHLLLARSEAACEALRCVPQSHGAGLWRNYQAWKR
jgi:GGDEF domain-containing protein